MTLEFSQKCEFTKNFLRFFGRFCDCGCGGVSQGFSCVSQIWAELIWVKKSTLARDRPSPYGLDDILIMILIISKYAKNVKKFLEGFGRGLGEGLGEAAFRLRSNCRLRLMSYLDPQGWVCHVRLQGLRGMFLLRLISLSARRTYSSWVIFPSL